MVHLGEVEPAICEQIIAEMEKKLEDVQFKRNDFWPPDWRKLAHHRKFEREAFAKYGYFKDFVLHPKVQMVKHYVEENVHFDQVQVGEPVLNMTHAIILLFMISRRLDNVLVMLIGAFLFNLNPVYVSAVALLTLLFQRNRSPKGYISPCTVPKGADRYKPKAAQELDLNKLAEQSYDHILLGSDVATLYTAALLSKCGHRCLVLQPNNSFKIEVQPEGAPCSAPLQQGTVSKVERYQPLLDTVQPLTNTDRVLFVPLGTAAEQFTGGIIKLSVAPMTTALGKIPGYHSTFFARIGVNALLSDLCSSLNVDRSKVLACIDRLKALWQHVTSFLLTRCVDVETWKKSKFATNEGTINFQSLAKMSLETFAYNCELEEHKVQTALQVLACTLGVDEYLPKNEVSAYALGLAMQAAESGRFVPAGGMQKLVLNLARTIRSSGGDVIHGVDKTRLDVEQVEGDGYRAVGVAINTTTTEEGVLSFTANRSVISGLGVLTTYCSLVHDILSSDMKQQISLLNEAKPRVKIIFWLDSSLAGHIKATDYFHLNISSPSPSPDHEAGKDSSSTNKQHSYVHMWSPSAQDPAWPSSQAQIIVVETDLPAGSVRRVRFEMSALVPSTEIAGGVEEGSAGMVGPKFYVDCHNPESDPNHVSFPNQLGRTIKLNKSKQNELLRDAQTLIQRLYPMIQDAQIMQTHVELPVIGGQKLANDTAKFAAALSAETEIKNLYLTGVDLAGAGLTGELQSGWITANTVLGYTLNELGDGRSVVQDIR